MKSQRVEIMNMPSKLIILLTITTLLFSTIGAASNFVTERGILENEVKGNSEINVNLDVADDIDPGYSIKVTSGLRDAKMDVGGTDLYKKFGSSTMIINPPLKNVKISISGTTPPAYSPDNFKNLELIEVDRTQYQYYRIVALDGGGKEITEVGADQKSFVLKEPQIYIDNKNKIESIENKKLKEIAQSLFNSGFLSVAGELALIELNEDYKVGFNVQTLVALIAFVVGIISGAFICYKWMEEIVIEDV